MKYLLAAALFAPIIYCAVRQKKWYLYLLVAFFAVLPEQFAVSVHEKLPLVSGTRILVVIAAVVWFVQRVKTRSFKPPVSLLIFLGINLALSLIHLPSDMDEIKHMFVLIMERGMVVIMLADMVESREEFDRCVDFVIMGACTMAVMGLVQTIFEYDIASALHITKTLASVTLTERMGLIRAYATMNAISYGCYCSFMVLPIYYRLQATGKQRYTVAFALNFVALLATFSRSAWLCIAGIVFLVFLTRPRKMLRSLWPSLVLVVALCVGLGFVQPKFSSALVETVKSSYNTVIGVLPEEWFTPEVTEPPVTEPTVTEPTITEPTETEPPVTEPTVTEPTVTESTETEPPVTEPTVTEPTVTEPTVTEPTITEPTETEPPVTEPPTTESTVNGPGFELSEDFGENAEDPTYSRMAQWSAVEYMLQEGTFLLGYGYNALPQGQIHFHYDRWSLSWQPWKATNYLDVGLVALVAETGLIGAIAHLGLFAFMLLQALRKRDRKGKFDFYKVVIFTVPLYLLLNFLAAYVNGAAVWLFIGLFYAYMRIDNKGSLEEERFD